MMMTNEELEVILKKYSLGELSSSPIERLTAGWMNFNYKFATKSDGKKYVLREYLVSTQRMVVIDEIQFELNFLSYLFHRYNLPVVPAIDPPGIFVLNHGTYAVIFPFIDGIKYLDTSNNPQRELWQTIEISRFLARMHSIELPMSFSSFTRRTINIVDVKYQLTFSCQSFEAARSDLYQRVREIVDKHITRIPLIADESEQIEFETNLERNLPKGLIHIDIHDENILFHPCENRIVAVLDFDDMSFGPYLLDIAMTLGFWSSIGSKFQLNYAREFLREYQQQRNQSLTDEEWNLLELYCYMTMFHQILFTIQSRDQHREIADDMIEELLSPLEFIANEDSFVDKLR